MKYAKKIILFEKKKIKILDFFFENQEIAGSSQTLKLNPEITGIKYSEITKFRDPLYLYLNNLT